MSVFMEPGSALANLDLLGDDDEGAEVLSAERFRSWDLFLRLQNLNCSQYALLADTNQSFSHDDRLTSFQKVDHREHSKVRLHHSRMRRSDITFLVTARG